MFSEKLVQQIRTRSAEVSLLISTLQRDGCNKHNEYDDTMSSSAAMMMACTTIDLQRVNFMLENLLAEANDQLLGYYKLKNDNDNDGCCFAIIMEEERRRERIEALLHFYSGYQATYLCKKLLKGLGLFHSFGDARTRKERTTSTCCHTIEHHPPPLLSIRQMSKRIALLEVKSAFFWREILWSEISQRRIRRRSGNNYFPEGKSKTSSSSSSSLFAELQVLHQIIFPTSSGSPGGEYSLQDKEHNDPEKMGDDFFAGVVTLHPKTDETMDDEEVELWSSRRDDDDANPSSLLLASSFFSVFAESLLHAADSLVSTASFRASYYPPCAKFRSDLPTTLFIEKASRLLYYLEDFHKIVTFSLGQEKVGDEDVLTHMASLSESMRKRVASIKCSLRSVMSTLEIEAPDAFKKREDIVKNVHDYFWRELESFEDGRKINNNPDGHLEEVAHHNDGLPSLGRNRQKVVDEASVDDLRRRAQRRVVVDFGSNDHVLGIPPSDDRQPFSAFSSSSISNSISQQQSPSPAAWNQHSTNIAAATNNIDVLRRSIQENNNLFVLYVPQPPLSNYRSSQRGGIEETGTLPETSSFRKQRAQKSHLQQRQQGKNDEVKKKLKSTTSSIEKQNSTDGGSGSPNLLFSISKEMCRQIMESIPGHHHQSSDINSARLNDGGRIRTKVRTMAHQICACWMQRVGRGYCLSRRELGGERCSASAVSVLQVEKSLIEQEMDEEQKRHQKFRRFSDPERAQRALEARHKKIQFLLKISKMFLAKARKRIKQKRIAEYLKRLDASLVISRWIRRFLAKNQFLKRQEKIQFFIFQILPEVMDREDEERTRIMELQKVWHDEKINQEFSQGKSYILEVHQWMATLGNISKKKEEVVVAEGMDRIEVKRLEEERFDEIRKLEPVKAAGISRKKSFR